MRYLPAIVWIILLSFVLTRHIKVYRVYDKQLKAVRDIERLGRVEAGSTLVAINQRVRYVIRIALAIGGLIIGVGGLYGIYSTGFEIGVLLYFYFSEIATGYLSIRDNQVLNHLLEIDQAGAEQPNTLS